MDLHSRRSFSGKRSFSFRTLITDDKQRLYRKEEKTMIITFCYVMLGVSTTAYIVGGILSTILG